MDADYLDRLDRVKKAGALLKRKAAVYPQHTASRLLDLSLREKDESVGYFRNDDVAREVTEHTLLFVRSLFNGGAGILKWVGDGRGLTDVPASQIIIESSYSNPDQEFDPSKPVIKVRSGPSGGGSGMGASTLKEWNIFTGTKVLTDLMAGTMQITCTHRNPVVSSEIAEYIRKNLLAFREEFLSRRLHDIQNVTVDGYDPNQRLRNQNTQSPTFTPISIVFQYYYQWMMKVSLRKGVYAPAKTFLWEQSQAPTSGGSADSVESGPARRIVHSLSLEDFEE